MTAPTYARRLGLFSGTMLVVGGVIGAGIFLNPSVVASRVGTPALTMLAWGLGAVVAIVGAFLFAELGARMPAAGGGYAYLRDAFGPLPAFLYGWALLLAVASGATAAVAVTFANYAGPLLGVPADGTRALAIGAIVLFSLVNILGVRPGAWVQNVLTLLKLLAIAALVVTGLLVAGSVAGTAGGAAAADVATAAGAALGSVADTLAGGHGAPVTPHAAPVGAWALAVALGTAMVPVLFTYGGWQQANFVAEEMVDPRRDLPRALVLGMLIVAAAYLLANLAYLNALGLEGLAASRAPAADTMALRLGPAGRTLMAAGVAASTAGFLLVVILVTPRVYQAMARDGVFFGALARLHPRTRTPANAIAAQGGWAIVLVLSGTYGDLLDWVTFADWIFFGATAATLVVHRRRRTGEAGGQRHDPTDAVPDPGARPAAPRAPFRAPFHPWSTGFFLLAAVYVVLGAIVSNPGNALRGTLVLAAGIPAFLWWRRRPAVPATPA